MKNDSAVEVALKECEEKGWMVRTINGGWKLTPEGRKYVEDMMETRSDDG